MLRVAISNYAEKAMGALEAVERIVDFCVRGEKSQVQAVKTALDVCADAIKVLESEMLTASMPVPEFKAGELSEPVAARDGKCLRDLLVRLHNRLGLYNNAVDWNDEKRAGKVTMELCDAANDGVGINAMKSALNSLRIAVSSAISTLEEGAGKKEKVHKSK